MRSLPPYSLLGLTVMLLSELFMWLHVEPFWSWHTPIVWTGYIVFVDGLVRVRRGSSWLTSSPAEFTFLAMSSIPLWLIFEFYNLFIQNWQYVNLPEHPFWRHLGYAWSFATIWPAIFETAEVVATVRNRRRTDRHGEHGGHRAVRESDSATSWTSVAIPGRGETPNGWAPRQPMSSLAWVSVVSGALMLLGPIVCPSPYLAAPVWLGFLLLLDPLNSRQGAEALSADWAGAGRERFVNLCLSGLVCGLLWEFWNYWARAKWIYTVPILPELKLFEMPLPGYLGFPPFALECFVLYVTVRRWLWRGRAHPIGL